MKKLYHNVNDKIFEMYSTQSVYEKLLDIYVPQVEAKKLAIHKVLKNKDIYWFHLRQKYAPKQINIGFKYAIYNNMVYEIESVIEVIESKKGKKSYHLKLKHLREVNLYSRKKCFNTYEEAVSKKDKLRSISKTLEGSVAN